MINDHQYHTTYNMINDHHIIGLAPGFLHEAGITNVLISLNCTSDGFYTNMKILYIIQKLRDGEPTAGVRFFDVLWRFKLTCPGFRTPKVGHRRC